MKQSNRLYNCPIPVIGITGNIATGKSTVSQLIREEGFSVICADQLIKNLYQKEETIHFIASLNNSFIIKSNNKKEINFTLLKEAFYSDEAIKVSVERFLHPKLEGEFNKSLSSSDEIIFYDVPLLFEKNMQDKFDQIIVVQTSQRIQRTRLKARDGMSEEMMEKIIQNQLPLEKKVPLSDYVLNNEEDIHQLSKSVLDTLVKIKQRLHLS